MAKSPVLYHGSGGAERRHVRMRQWFGNRFSQFGKAIVNWHGPS